MREITTIFKKELLEVIRDRRTLFFMLVFPTVILPLMMNLLFGFIEGQAKKASNEVLPVAILNAEALPELSDLFRDNEKFELVTSVAEEDVRSAIKDGTIKFALAIPRDAASLIASRQKLELKLTYDNASATSRVVRRAQEVINGFADQLRETRLRELGVSILEREGLIEPVDIQKIGIADDRERIGENMGGLLPYFFILMCLVGAIYPALDLGVGEKERGTLETLLLTPVPRSYLVWGKFLVVWCSSITSAMLCTASFGTYILFMKGKSGSEGFAQIFEAVGPSEVALILLMLVPLAMILASALLALSIYARSFKEAQGYIAPLNFMVIVPAFLPMLPGITFNWKWAMVPIANVAFAIKETIKGTVDMGMVAIIFATTMALALVCAGLCVRWFQKEEVLFRS